ncbi:uncharacterized protein DUF4403 [Larkinella arboricola]|uniref:Uncharacterized protein DUF4403 n=1 Tax=Larkinella arboricola TaxID=643671 RepID=A0A327X0J1_LARAB|nr:DUF4403 family protein [Larkinella arboricola]RAJ99970.1 uncharacterized protein DUF4403 [Larkinella arboricola]
MREESEHNRLLYYLICTTFLAFILAGVFACNRVNPEPPSAQNFDDSLTADSSYVSAPVLFEITELEEKVNKALGKVLVQNATIKNGIARPLNLRIERSGPIRLAFNGQKLSFSASLRIWLSNPFRLSGQDSSDRVYCALHVRFRSPLTVREDWRMQTNVELENYRWITEPEIRVLGMRIPVTRLADQILEKRENGIENAIDRAIFNGLRLDREIARIWQNIQKPLLINRNFQEVWLRPKPFAVLVGPIRGNPTELVIPMRIKLRMESLFGPKPDYALNLPLPRLQKVASLPMNSHVSLLSRVPYSQLSTVLNSFMSGTKLNVINHLVDIKKIRVYGGEHSLIVQADIKGAIGGSLYFRGRPVFDTVRKELVMRNLDYDIHTEQSLAKVADWLLHDTLKDTLQSTLRIPLEEHFTLLPDKIEGAFARAKAGKKARINIPKFELSPKAIAVRPDGLQILLHADAAMMLEVVNL